MKIYIAINLLILIASLAILGLNLKLYTELLKDQNKRRNYLMNEVERVRDALDHIEKTARASRSQTRRLRWIAERARYALEGKSFPTNLDLPPSVESEHFRISRQLVALKTVRRLSDEEIEKAVKQVCNRLYGEKDEIYDEDDREFYGAIAKQFELAMRTKIEESENGQ